MCRPDAVKWSSTTGIVTALLKCIVYLSSTREQLQVSAVRILLSNVECVVGKVHTLRSQPGNHRMLVLASRLK